MVEPLYSSEESTIFYYFSVKDRIIEHNYDYLLYNKNEYGQSKMRISGKMFTSNSLISFYNKGNRGY